MSRAPPASLVSVTVMRQYHTGAVTPRWGGRSVRVRCRPIMRDKLLQTSALWRWADGVWRRQRRGGFPHESVEAKAEGKMQEEGEERPRTPNVAGKKKKQAEMKRETAAYERLIKTHRQLVCYTQRWGVFFNFFL